MKTGKHKSTSDGKTKALDLLDRHISQRSSLKKPDPSSVPSTVHLGETRLLKPDETENVLERSSTPKNAQNPLPADAIGSIEMQRWSEEDRSPFSSPARKGVSFSDKIESSPISQSVGSSPIRPSSMAKPPIKSILKNTPAECIKSENNTRNRGSPKKPSHLSIDPFTPDFWVEGEIHQMLDPNNIAEFRKLVEGGITVLNNNKMKDFEVYATFNNIMPHMVGNFINDSMHQKTDVIINNLEALMSISIHVLKNLQDSLLLSHRKDPFKSRCYIQVVRFLSSLFSNFRIIKHLDGNFALQQHFKSVLGCMTEVLTHANTSKAIVIYPLTLLEDEKFGQLYLPEAQLKVLLDAVLEMKEFDSTNVQCERLTVLRQFLQKYNKIMSERLTSWFPNEVLSKYLTEQKIISPKVLASCNMIILELLRRFISNQKVRYTIYQIGEMDSRCVFNREVNLKTQNTSNQEHKIKLTIGEALCTKLKQMIVDRMEYRLAMDCWLGICGLLFNSEEDLKKLLTLVGKRWLSVNEICFELEDTSIKNVAIKNRRILNYMILTNMSPHSTEEIVQCLSSVILRPFTIEDAAVFDDSIKSTYNGVFYLIFCNSKDISGIRFKFLKKVVLKPLLKLAGSQNLVEILGHHTLQLLVKIFKPLSDEEKTLQKNSIRFQPLKVISAVGVDISDFESMPLNISMTNWDALVEIVKEIVSWEIKDSHLWCTLLQYIIRRTPANEDRATACEKNLHLCRKMLFHKLFPRDSILEPIIRPLAETFGLHLFSINSIFLTDIINMEALSKQQQFETFKNLFNQVKTSVNQLVFFGAFSSYNNPLISSYIGNAVGSMLLPKNMSTSEFDNLLVIVNRTPIPEVIDNLFTWLRKTNKWETIATKLNISSWEDELFANFIPKWIHERKGIWSEQTINMVNDSLWQRPRAFRQLASFLIKCGQKDILKNTLNKAPGIIDDLTLLSDLSLPEILPLPLILSSFAVIDKYDDVIKTHLFLCASIHKRIDVIKKHLNLLSDLLLPTDDDVTLNNERTSIIDTVIMEAIRIRDWELFIYFFNIYMARKEQNKIIAIFTDQKYHEIIWSNCFPLILNKSESLDAKLLPKFIGLLKNESPTFSLNIIEHLILAGKHQVFVLHKDDILRLFFDTTPALSSLDKEKAVLIFPQIVEYYMKLDVKSLVVILKYVVKLMKETNDSLYGAKLIMFFLDHSKFEIQGNKRLLKKLNGYKGNLQRSERSQVSCSTDLNSIAGNLSRVASLKNIDSMTNIPKESDEHTTTEQHFHDGENNKKNSLCIVPNGSNLHVRIPTSDPLTTSKGQKDYIQGLTTNDSNALDDGSIKKRQCIKFISSNPSIALTKETESISFNENYANDTVSNCPVNSLRSSDIPLKIPIFNPFADKVNIEDECEVTSSKQDNFEASSFKKRSYETMCSHGQEKGDVHKNIREVINTLHSFTDEEFSKISHQDRIALRNDLLQFLNRLAD